MNYLVKAAMVAAVLGASRLASAGTFDFSYSFGDGQQVTGSFDGVTSNGGQSVTDITDLQVALNGIAFAPVTSGGVTFGNATLQINNWNSSLAAPDDTTPATIFANGSLNNFVISDVDAATSTSPDYEFAYINDAANGINQAVAANFLQSDAFSTAEGSSTQLAIDSPANAGSWQMSAVAPVPLPASLPLLLSGLGLFGIGRRMRLV